MLQHPAILAMVGSSLLVCAMVIYAGGYGLKILQRWDLLSGSEEQLELERRTYLISVILGYALLFQIMSFFLFIYTADSLHSLFVGAMCAAGSLNANGFGYPVLLLKTVNCILSGTWLLLNWVDAKGYDYPLIRPKYILLLLLALLITVETVTQITYFSGLHADVITSCCGSLFSSERRNIAGELSGAPIRQSMLFFGFSLATCGVSGTYFLGKGKGGYIFSLLGTVFFLAAVTSLVSFISLYFYELPSHHCPFCILQKEYGHVGYLLYATLLVGEMATLGVGFLAPFRTLPSMKMIIPLTQKRLALAAMILFALFTATIAIRIGTTPFTLGIFG
ncbi:MAG TPA: hypothetical protein VFF53_02350 [Geobacteraceae bacterium]|nr:hypothetical protein [Geobacteraceae bacterium]